MSELLRLLNSTNTGITDCKIKPEDLGKLLQIDRQRRSSGKIAKSVFEEMFATGKNPEDIIKDKGLTQISDEDTISKIVEDVLANNPVRLRITAKEK